MRKNLLIVAAFTALSLAACGQQGPIDEKALDAPTIADFSKGKSEEVFASDGWSNGQPFNAVWTKDNITYSDGKMKLSIQDKEAEADGVTYPHTAGESRTHKLYGYGDFEVRMKPSNVVGSVSTFFTYTDKWNKVDGVENKHDEIDIEFLGKDTRKVQFNYFVGGQGNHEYMYDLGFDASEEFHNYGFRWAKNAITWFVDGNPVYQVRNDNADALPSQNGRILCSYWPSSLASWSGTYQGPSDKTCEYEWIKSSGNTIYADGEEPVPEFDDKIEWDKVSPTDLTFSADPEDSGYTVTKEDGVTKITYEQPKAWKNVVASAPEVVNSNDAVSLVIKNNSATASEVRIDVQGQKQVGNRDALNTMARSIGGSGIYTDLEWGGTKLSLDPNEEANVIIKYDVTTNRGLAKNILVFADSLSENPAAHAGGNITVKDFKFASTSGQPVVPPEPGPEPVDTPITLMFANEPYTCDNNTETGVSTITYDEVKDNSYVNVFAPIADIVSEGQNRLSFDLQNFHETDNVQLNIKVVKDESSYVEPLDSYDYYNVGERQAQYNIAAGQTRNCVIAFDGTVGVTGLLIFINSSWAETTTTHTNGHMTFSNVKVSTVSSGDPSGVDWSSIDAENFSLWASSPEIYTVNNEGTSSTVTYSQAGGWACCGASLTSAATGKNYLTITLANNSQLESTIRFDLQSTITGNCPVTSIWAGDRTDIVANENYEMHVTLAAGESVTLVVGYTANETVGEINNLMFFIDSEGDVTAHEGGSITISDIKFALAE